MPLICEATSSWLRNGSSPVVVRLRPQFGSRSRSVCGPNRPVTMKARLSAPSVCPHTFPSPRSNVAPRPISVIGAVDPRAFGPDVLSTPWASVQQMYEMLGVVSVTYAGRPLACALARGAAKSRPVPPDPTVPTAAIVTCSASEVASTQIAWPTVKGVTLATLMLVAPAVAAAASVVPATLPDASRPNGRPTGPTLWQSGLGPSWSSVPRFCTCASVGVAVGSSWAMRLSTAGVYGAAASTDGAFTEPGSETGIVYGGVSAAA